MTKEAVVTIAVMLPPSMIEYLEKLGVEQDMNRSQLIRKMIREYQMVHNSKSKK